jgi:threonine efflux protein
MLYTLLLIHFLALVSPGPDFLFVSQTAMSRSRREALFGVLGVTLGVAVWATMALLGWHVVLAKAQGWQTALTVVGGAFLIYMGASLLWVAYRERHAKPKTPQAVPPAAHSGKPFLKGLLTNLSNPKALIYFGSIFSLYVNADMSGATVAFILVAVTVETFLWFYLVMTIFKTDIARVTYQHYSRVIDTFVGVLFLALGCVMVVATMGNS